MAINNSSAYINYVDSMGNEKMALYSSLTEAQADAAALNAAIAAGTTVFMGNDKVDPTGNTNAALVAVSVIAAIPTNGTN